MTLCPVATPDDPRGFLNHYLRPATSFFAQSLYAGTAGPTQVAAFETALDARPEAIFVHRLDAMCPALLTRRPLPPIYLDLDDIEHVKVVRQLRQPPFWPGKYLYCTCSCPPSCPESGARSGSPASPSCAPISIAIISLRAGGSRAWSRFPTR